MACSKWLFTKNHQAVHTQKNPTPPLLPPLLILNVCGSYSLRNNVFSNYRPLCHMADCAMVLSALWTPYRADVPEG